LYWGAFSRTVELPNDIAVDQSEAVEKHGLLIVRLPKIDKERNVKVKVKSI
jgi:HSP20 family molecular chaperone IbpA